MVPRRADQKPENNPAAWLSLYNDMAVIRDTAGQLAAEAWSIHCRLSAQDPAEK